MKRMRLKSEIAQQQLSDLYRNLLALRHLSHQAFDSLRKSVRDLRLAERVG